MLRNCFCFAALLSISYAIAAGAQSTVSLIHGRIDESVRTTLHGTVHPLANAANDRGLVNASQPLGRIHLMLGRSASQEKALKSLLAEQQKPGSANYHKWLTPTEFGKKFGPSESDVATVESWLSAHGFAVKGLMAGRQVIEFSGNAEQMQAAFGTRIHKYEVAGESHYATANEAQIPTALTGIIKGFAALNNFRPHRMSKVKGQASFERATGKATANWTTGSNSAGYNLVLAPGDFAVQYNLNPLYKAGYTGSGQTIAIVNDANINVALANQFRTLFGLSANPPQVIVDGNDPGIDGQNNPDGPNYDSVEAYLDVEWAGAVAPAATIDLVIAGNTELEAGLYLAAERAVYSNVAPVVSVSFGECEANLGSGNAFFSALWEQAAAQGQTVVVSSGDSGVAGCDYDGSQYYAINGQAVNGIASTPYNIAVGGTDFYYSAYASGSTTIKNQIWSNWSSTASNATPKVSLLNVLPEQPWNESQYGLNINDIYSESSGTETLIVGGGGGASTAGYCSTGSWSSGSCTGSMVGYPKPTWQSGVGVPTDSVRDLPDVSLFASSGINASYYPICYADGDCQSVASTGTVQITGIGGTSASAPAFAGILALVNQKYGRQGQANQVLYPMKAQYPASFHDISVGSNTVPCAMGSTNCIAVSNPYTITDPSYGTAVEGEIGSGSTPYYQAAAGYNLATGLGSVDAYQLFTNWGSVSFASTTTTLSASQTSFAHGTSITVSGAVSGSSATPTGDIALMTDNTNVSSQGLGSVALSSGNYSTKLNSLPGGSYNLWANYGGDTANAASTSAKTSITVTPEASGIFFNVLNPNSNGITTIGSGTTNIPYGTQLMLSAMPAPSSSLTAFAACELGTSTSCPSFEIPTGSVLFKDGTATLATAAINAEGDAEFNVPFTVGTHSVTATYSGNNSYKSSSSSTIGFTVVKATPYLALSAANETSYGQIVSGQPTVFNLQVMNRAQANSAILGYSGAVPVAAPTGTLTVTSIPAGISGSAALSAATDSTYGAVEGVGTITAASTLAKGNYQVKVVYPGDTNYAAVTRSFTVPVVSASGISSTTTAKLTGTISPTTSVVVSGTVVGKTGYGAPTGSMFVYSSGIDLGEVSLTAGTGTSITSTYAITLNSSSLLQGTNQLTLQYSGSTTYSPSAATVSNISNTLADFTLVPSASIIALQTGSTATGTLNVGSLHGYTGAVALACSAPSGITCSVASSVTLTSGGQGTATVTVSTPYTTAAGNYSVLITGKNASGNLIHTAALSVPITINSKAPSGALSTALVSFGSVITGQSATAQTVTFKNSGTAAMTISSVTLTGTNATSFSLSNACGTSLAAGASCNLTLGFKPLAGGPLTAAVTVTDNAVGSPSTIALSGTGLAPSVSFSPSSLSFGSVGYGTTSSTQTVTLTNSGTGALNITSMALGGAAATSFNLSNGCGMSVAAGSSCKLTISMSPRTTGALSGSVTLTDNASPTQQSIALSGTGVAPIATLSPASLSFASTYVGVASATQTVKLSNTGTAALTLSSVALTGTNTTSFTTYNNCNGSVAIGGSCLITVAFVPAAKGALSAKITLTDNAVSGTQAISLAGTGLASTAGTSTTLLSFGSLAVGSTSVKKTVNVTNTGNTVLTIIGITLAGNNTTSFSYTSACGTTLAAGASCSLSVGFVPKQSGNLGATINVATSASNGTQSVQLTGTGL